MRVCTNILYFIKLVIDWCYIAILNQSFFSCFLFSNIWLLMYNINCHKKLLAVCCWIKRWTAAAVVSHSNMMQSTVTVHKIAKFCIDWAWAWPAGSIVPFYLTGSQRSWILCINFHFTNTFEDFRMYKNSQPFAPMFTLVTMSIWRCNWAPVWHVSSIAPPNYLSLWMHVWRAWYTKTLSSHRNL